MQRLVTYMYTQLQNVHVSIQYARKKGLKRLQKEANASRVKPSCSETQNDNISPRKANLYDTEAFAKHQRTHTKGLNHKSLIIFFYADDNCLK